MSDATPSPTSDEATLARLAEFDLAAVERAHGRYMAAPDGPEASAAARDYQRMARSLRQSIALKHKIAQDAAKVEREIAHNARIKEILHPNGEDPRPPKRLFPRDIPAANQRAGEIRVGMQRLLWSEGFEKSDYDCEQELEGHFFRCLEDFLAEDRLKDDFTTRDLDEQIAELAKAFGLNPDNIPRWRELPDPDPETVEQFLADDSDDGEHPKWRSSG